MNIVILAAGKGTRMKSELPKVLHPVGGAPMLSHVMLTAAALKPSKLIVVIGYGASQIRHVFDQFSHDQLPKIDWAIQDPPMGTGHAVLQAVPLLDNHVPTLILYGDVPLITANTLARLLDSANQVASDRQGMALLTANLKNPFGYGRIVRDQSGSIMKVVEEKDADTVTKAIEEINTGTLFAPTAPLIGWLSKLDNQNSQKEFYLTDIIQMAVTEGYPIGSAQPASVTEIMGINSQAQRAELERVYQLRLANAAMAGGVALADPDRFDVRGQLECDQDVFIDIGCMFEGHVVLEKGVRVGPHCVIKDSRVAAGARIEAFSHIESAAIGPAAVIGPYARLRPGSQIGEGAHVGNFVEIKNTTLGAGSKANHLSYLGDASIGSRVNIGAGTITCNYDGASKHQTVIEDDAFIGSDSQLVAPVTVGRGATLGAGTTLTHDAPADQLTVSRNPQVSISRWKRPQKKAH